jgi:hypothetical protein
MLMKSRLSLAVCLLAFAGAAAASGSVSQPQTVPRTQQATGEDAYARGKKIYMEKLACETCPVAGGVQDKNAAMSLVGRIDAGEFGLQSKQKKQVKAYLKNRFGLK